MKKNAYFAVYCIVCVCVVAAAAALGGLSVYAFVKGEAASGAVLLIFAVGFLLALAAMAARERLDRRCVTLFTEGKYDEERAYLERVRKSPFSFLTLTVAMYNYVLVCMALDDIAAAEPIIERLRHGGGAGWKYKTAYLYILIRLDGGDRETAHTEFEEFRKECAHAEIYREQIEVLTAIFRRVYQADVSEPLPQAAVNSRFPIVGRVLGKMYEQRAAESVTEWGE